MNRSRVLTARPRSDQFREIESHAKNVSVHSIAQSRNFPEVGGLRGGYFTQRLRSGAAVYTLNSLSTRTKARIRQLPV